MAERVESKVAEDRPMTPAECEAMWKQVYKAERDRFERERDEARAEVEQLTEQIAGFDVGLLREQRETIERLKGRIRNLERDRYREELKGALNSTAKRGEA